MIDRTGKLVRVMPRVEADKLLNSLDDSRPRHMPLYIEVMGVQVVVVTVEVVTKKLTVFDIPRYDAALQNGMTDYAEVIITFVESSTPATNQAQVQ